MNHSNKRMNRMDAEQSAKRVKKECSYGASCYRMNPAHFREYSHPHLESILDSWSGGEYDIPAQLGLQRSSITDQLNIIVEKKLYEPSNKVAQGRDDVSSVSTDQQGSSKQASQDRNSVAQTKPTQNTQAKSESRTERTSNSVKRESVNKSEPSESVKSRGKSDELSAGSSSRGKSDELRAGSLSKGKSDELSAGSSSRGKSDELSAGSSCRGKSDELSAGSSSRGKSDELSAGSSRKEKSVSSAPGLGARVTDSSYRPVVGPTRRAEDYLAVVRPRGLARAKLAAAAPYHLFYTTIAAAPQTHHQPYSITFLELLDASLGELQSSLQINFMVEPAWLLAQYYFAGYSAKKLTILYGEECADMKQLSNKPAVDAVRVHMATPFGKHHTKMMLLCYEDGSLRVVVSTANLYQDDWENRTQGLWVSPCCAPLPHAALPHDGESPTMFKRSLLRYLAHYRLPSLATYVERVKRCDFSHINVFLVASVPGSHMDLEWGMARAGALLRQHCAIPAAETRSWPLVAQASSLGSYGADPKLWLTGDFLQHFTKIKSPPQALTQPPPLQLIYPSLENVKQSHDGLLGGGCLPYAADCHAKQPWLNDFLYQWRAERTCRSRAMPHVKSYCRARAGAAAYFLLTSANVSKAAWGSFNKGNRALRIMSYEAGVMLLPAFVINADVFPLGETAGRLVVPYDLPPTKYTADMSPWVQDHLY